MRVKSTGRTRCVGAPEADLANIEVPRCEIFFCEIDSNRRNLITKKQNLDKFASNLYFLDPESQKFAKKGGFCRL